MAGSTRAGLILDMKVLAEQVQQGLVEYAVKMRRELSSVIKQQMRILINDVLKGTPPIGGRNSRNESFGFQRKIGQNAISRDVSRVFVSIEQIAAKNTKLGPAIKTALDQNNMAVLGHGNSLPELLVKAKVMDQPQRDKIVTAPYPELMDQFRNSRGRVGGRIPFPYFVRRTAALKKFVSELWDHEGILKGGWGAGVSRFGASAPQWISRHFSGEVVDQSDSETDPFAIARNTVPYIDVQNSDLRIAANAMKDRRNSMERQIQAYTERTEKL